MRGKKSWLGGLARIGSESVLKNSVFSYFLYVDNYFYKLGELKVLFKQSCN